MRAEHVERVETDDEEVAVRSVRELLEADVGRAVRLHLGEPHSPLASGTILEVLGDAGLCAFRTEAGPALAVPFADVRYAH